MTQLPEPIEAPLPYVPQHGWTPALKTRFLDRLAEDGNAHAACRKVGLSRQSAYRLRRRDKLFGRAWNAAVLLGREASQQLLREFATEGVVEDFYYRGEYAGKRRRFDGRLLLAHLGRLDRLVDDKASGEDAGRFDELLAEIAGEEAEALARPTRETLLEEAAALIETRRRGELAEYHQCAVADLDEVLEDTDDDPMFEQFVEELDEECAEWQASALRAAEQRHAGARDSLFDRLDALCEAPPSAAPPPVVHAALLPPAERSSAPLAMPGGKKARTLSTVSTSALCHVPGSGFGRPLAETPRTPFAAKGRNTLRCSRV